MLNEIVEIVDLGPAAVHEVLITTKQGTAYCA